MMEEPQETGRDFHWRPAFIVCDPFSICASVYDTSIEINMAAIGIGHPLQIQDRAESGPGIKADHDEANNVTALFFPSR
jgi:hypothetical protein